MVGFQLFLGKLDMLIGTSTNTFTQSTTSASVAIGACSYAVGEPNPVLLADSFVTGLGDASTKKKASYYIRNYACAITEKKASAIEEPLL